MSKNLYILLLCLFMAVTAAAQKITVAGTVTDAEGEPLIGASVADKSAPGNGVVTDLDGHYSISVSPQATLEFSYIGYIQQSVAVDGRQTIDIVMQDNSTTLDEVVVIGYGYSEPFEDVVVGSFDFVERRSEADHTERSLRPPGPCGRCRNSSTQPSGANSPIWSATTAVWAVHLRM